MELWHPKYTYTCRKDDRAKIYSTVYYLRSFFLLQEVCLIDTGSKLLHLDAGDKYEFYWCGYKKKGEAGAGILIKVDKNIEINKRLDIKGQLEIILKPISD